MKTLAWFVSLAALLASPAWAQDDFGRAGAYAAFLGVGAIETFDEPSGLDFSDGGGFNMRAGYRFMEYVAAEMQFEYVEGFSDQGIDIESWNLMWNVKGFPLTGRVQPYALFGMGVLYAEASGGGRSIDDEGFAVRVGGGMDFYATENIVLTGEVNFVQPTGDVDDLSYVTIGGGLQYRF
jgi:opacity protein-like surface antigen